MKKTAFALLVFMFLCSCFLHAQTRPPQDVRRVTVTSKYEIVNGKKNANYKAIKQELYDSLGRMHTLVNLDYISGEISSFIWFTYEGITLKTIELFEKGNLTQRKEYSFSKDSMMKFEKNFKIKNNLDTILDSEVEYTLNNSKMPIKVVAKNHLGKKMYTVNSVYDVNGSEIRRKVSTSRGYFPADSIVSLNKLIEYDLTGRVVNEKLNLKYYRGISFIKTISYQYDEKGNLSKKTINDEGSLKVFKYGYNSNGRLMSIEKYDSNNILIEALAIRYELYPTPDRRFRRYE